MSADTFRAVCAELLAAWQKGGDIFGPMNRARALLAQPEPEGPTDEELWELYQGPGTFSPVEYARSVLARWGHPTPRPVPVSERLPGPKDCTARGWCWTFYKGFGTWALEPPLGQDGKHTGYTHWLPANALPLPQGNDI